MNKKSKKIITSLLIILSLVTIFPTANAFAKTQEDEKYLEFIENECTPTERGNIFKKDGKYYLLKDSLTEGKVKPKVGKNGSYFTYKDGSLATNEWKYTSDESEVYDWYYYSSDGENVTNYQTINNKLYRFGKNTAKLYIGWYTISGEGTDTISSWHYSYPDGSIKEGWVQDGGKWYYVNNNGAMLKNTTTPDGYKVNKKGEWIS